jgi:hypothetical protein
MTQERPAIESERARPKLPKVISSSWLIMFCVFIGKNVSQKSLLVNSFFQKKLFKKKLDSVGMGVVA